MTRRERLESKRERRKEWARKRADKAAGLRKTNADDPQSRDWAFITQPGKIPARERMNRRDERAHEHDSVARHHERKAEGLSRKLDREIFADDEDAVERLEERIAEREARRERGKRINAAWRKAGKPDPLEPEAWRPFVESIGPEDAAFAERGLRHQRRADVPGMFSWAKPYDPKHDGAAIRRDQKRLEEIKTHRERRQRAEDAGGVLVEHPTDRFTRVTFVEAPGPEVVSSLRVGGFRWDGTSWAGLDVEIPDSVEALT